MNLKVYGYRHKLYEEEITTAAYFYAVNLLSTKMIENIDVEIYIKSSMQDLGNCTITHFNRWGKPRFFEIQLKHSRNVDKMIFTLAHEFVHLKQFAYEQLNDENTKWHGFEIDSESVGYSDLPWEIEASCLEYVLFEDYKQYKYLNDAKRPIENNII